jgi:hypothetical protein
MGSGQAQCDPVPPMVPIGRVIAADNVPFPKDFRPDTKKYSLYLAWRHDVRSITVPVGMGEEITVRTR